MKRREFIEQLERLLLDIPWQEREEALNYYEGYFDDAGEENESAIIQELGSPGKVAAIIKADLKENKKDYGEFTENGFGDARFDERNMPEKPENIKKEETKEDTKAKEESNQDGSRNDGQNSNQSGSSRYNGPYSKYGYGNGRTAYRTQGSSNANKRSSSTWILIIIVAVLTSPIWIGLGAGILGIAVGIVAALFAVIVALLACGVGLLGGGVVVVVYSLLHLSWGPAAVIAFTGGGILMIAVGILLMLAFGALATKAFPVIFRGIVDFIQRIFHKGMKGGSRT